LLREEDANSFGVESAGAWQIRGNGNLALTKHELLFAQWMPNRLLRIRRASIVLWVRDLDGWLEALRA
jgi:hypothetical protein